MPGPIFFIVIGTILIIVGILLAIFFFRKKQITIFRSVRNDFERDRNLIAGIPIASELSKVEPVLNNDKMEEKFQSWQERHRVILEEKLPQIDDFIIDFDTLVEQKKFKEAKKQLIKTEMMLAKARSSAELLLSEIQEITLSEEKYRSIVTKLKTKYREMTAHYQEHKEEYGDIQNVIDLQLENIEKRFMDFEKAMEKGEYNDVVHIVKAIDTMVDHMAIIVEEIPDLFLLSTQFIPRRMEQIQAMYREMSEQGYPLEYLNIEYNLEESQKNVKTILDRIRVLNLVDCMFELKTILDYLDSLFNDFEKERLSRKVYDEIDRDFHAKLKKTRKIVRDIYKQFDHIKENYDLNPDEITKFDEINKQLIVIYDSYKMLCGQVKDHAVPYSKSHAELEKLSGDLRALEDDLDHSLTSLGSMYDDEVRAREQLDQIRDLLKQCKDRMKDYKLPIVTDLYFVQLAEANEAINEIMKELDKRPIVIATLNTRVDTARDLILKLYHTTNRMIQMAELSEKAIVYGNRYRSTSNEVEIGLNQATKQFFKGEYQKALETALHTLDLVEPGIYRKLWKHYEA